MIIDWNSEDELQTYYGLGFAYTWTANESSLVFGPAAFVAGQVYHPGFQAGEVV